MSTIKEIAIECGLSSAAVSRVLRNDPGMSVSPEARIRIQQAVQKLGAPSLYKKKSLNMKSEIGIIHKQITFRSQIDSSYYFAIRSGIEEFSEQNKFQLSFIPMPQLEEFQNYFDGYIIIGNYSKDDFTYIMRRIGNKPAACIGMVSYFSSQVDHITFSNNESLSLGMDYLIENGHSKIGYLGVIEAAGTIETRKHMYMEYVKRLGTYNPQWLRECEHGEDRVMQGYMMMKEWLSEMNPMPTALFIANDPVALGALNAINESGLSVPNNLSIVSHDCIFPSQYSSPALTTVDVHPYQLGIEAGTALMERISGKRKVTKTVLLHPELLIRESVLNLKEK